MSKIFSFIRALTVCCGITAVIIWIYPDSPHRADVNRDKPFFVQKHEHSPAPDTGQNGIVTFLTAYDSASHAERTKSDSSPNADFNCIEIENLIGTQDLFVKRKILRSIMASGSTELMTSLLNLIFDNHIDASTRQIAIEEFNWKGYGSSLRHIIQTSANIDLIGAAIDAAITSGLEGAELEEFDRSLITLFARSEAYTPMAAILDYLIKYAPKDLDMLFGVVPFEYLPLELQEHIRRLQEAQGTGLHA